MQVLNVEQTKGQVTVGRNRIDEKALGLLQLLSQILVGESVEMLRAEWTMNAKIGPSATVYGRFHKAGSTKRFRCLSKMDGTGWIIMRIR